MKQKNFSIPSKIEAIDDAVRQTTEFAADNGFGDEHLFGIDMAVREALANAVKHGNRLDETKPVEVALEFTGSDLTVQIRDRGSGFDVSAVPDPTNPENLMKASGRGILFMHNFVDRVEWSTHAEGGTIVKMTKSR